MFQQPCNYELFSLELSVLMSLKAPQNQFGFRLLVHYQSLSVHPGYTDQSCHHRWSPVHSPCPCDRLSSLEFGSWVTQFDSSHGQLVSWGWDACLWEHGAPVILGVSQPHQERRKICLLLILKSFLPTSSPSFPKGDGNSSCLLCVISEVSMVSRNAETCVWFFRGGWH